ncbi:hypothetical protein MBORA_13790 [Methanobrevibacter oralis]|uniref:SpoVT-AbrB domain-containing protein n=2 Tax=Methanobacteriaceae TaxID=2159 RepID=A0A166AC29_METOA|nr:hypothetical protein MBORA_13790 [Methanobrevibacter oralis]
MIIMTLATSKLYGNDELHLPKIIKDEFKDFPIDKNTIFDWDIQDNNIIITPRQKTTFDDVFGMIDDDGEDWNIDELIYDE